MNLRLIASCGFFCAALFLTGCEEGRQEPGKVAVQVVNVAPGFVQLSYRREQDVNNAATMSFKSTQVFAYDADTYDFYVIDRTVDLNDPGRSWTFAAQLDARTNYTFVLTEANGEVQPVVIAHPPAHPTDSVIIAVHAASGLPAMDLYLERPGVGIAGATPRGSFDALAQITSTLPSGEYELWLTAAGNPADVVLASTTLALGPGTLSTFIVAPEAGQGTAELSVLLLQEQPTLLYDRDTANELRVINAATDRLPRDFAVDSQFSPPLFSAMPFGEPTAYGPMPNGASRINVTPAGNPGVLELDQTYSGLVGQRATMLVNGPAGTLTAAVAADDGRRINREAKIRFMNAASQFLAIDYVITYPDGDPFLLFPQAQLFAPAVGSYLPLAPGDYDLHLLQTGTATRLSGPTRISVAAGGIYGVLAVDGPDTATADVLLLDDFP